MYRQKPWTLEDKKQRVRKSPYIKNRQADLAISTAKVLRLFRENKEKTYSNNEIASILGISLGTVSGITNRLEAIKNIKIVKVRQLKSALSQVFQHSAGSSFAVTKERGKEDTIVSVFSLFVSNKNKVFTKDEIMHNLTNSEGQIRLALQILLLNGEIKLVGETDKRCAQYQHKDGNKKGFQIFDTEDENYITLPEYLELNNLKEHKNFFEQNAKTRKYRRFYTSKGILKQYLKEDLDKIKDSLNKKPFLNSLLTNF